MATRKPPPGGSKRKASGRGGFGPTPAKGVSYTPSPAVKSNVPGKSGGIWRDSQNRVIGTSKSEDSPIRKTKAGPRKRSTSR